jgi:hypothetical protein
MFVEIDKIEELIPKLEKISAQLRAYTALTFSGEIADACDAIVVIARHIADKEHKRRMLEDCQDD